MYNLEEPTVYTSEKNGNDETGDGSEEKPFKTPLQVFIKKKTKILILIFLSILSGISSTWG